MSIWQTKQWQNMLTITGQVEKSLEIEFNGKTLYIEKRKLGFSETGLFILGFEDELTTKLEKQLIDICKKENSLFIQIETLNYYKNTNFNTSFTKSSYKKFITPYTAVINLNSSEENIQKNMKSKGRYNIRLAGRKGVEIIEAPKTDENIQEFYRLMEETTARDKFSGNSFEYYKNFLLTLDNAKLLLAIYNEEVIAAGILVFTPEVSIYYYGASSGQKEYRKLMAPYLLQWEAIKIAKSKDSKLYDFLGVATPEDTQSALIGVTDFKKKFTQDIRKVSNSYMFINKKIKYKLIQLLRKIKNKNS